MDFWTTPERESYFQKIQILVESLNGLDPFRNVVIYQKIERQITTCWDSYFALYVDDHEALSYYLYHHYPNLTLWYCRYPSSKPLEQSLFNLPNLYVRLLRSDNHNVFNAGLLRIIQESLPKMYRPWQTDFEHLLSDPYLSSRMKILI
ncbi:MAG: hypothetical protein ACYCQJ_12335 [Nitrososphaerales archaeon]